MSLDAYLGADIHDGRSLHHDSALLVEDGRIAGIVPEPEVPPGARRTRLAGGTICPGFVDLQVNGGGGVMLGDAPDVATLRTIAKAHAGRGTLALLPTLITDTPERTRATVAAVEAAMAEGVAGIAGLHLEGPHLSLARKGAHDPSLVRPMDEDDLAFLCAAAGRLPNLLLTVAPESVTPEQIAALDRAGAIVSLGHSDADYDRCRAAFRAGARMVTHLFNAMSPLSHRAPGLVGAALDTPGISIGLIADAIHVHPAAIRVALTARPDELFLVTDAMAPAGSDMTSFTLGGRRIAREGGRLALGDGTLAGADLDMPRALRVMTEDVGVGLATAISMASARPAAALRQAGTLGRLGEGTMFRALHLAPGTLVPTVLAPRAPG